MVGASQDMAFGTIGGAEGLSLAGTQPRRSKVSHSWASPSLCLSALRWDPLLRLHKIFSPSFAEPYAALAFHSTERKADTEVVKKKMAFDM